MSNWRAGKWSRVVHAELAVTPVTWSLLYHVNCIFFTKLNEARVAFMLLIALDRVYRQLRFFN